MTRISTNFGDTRMNIFIAWEREDVGLFLLRLMGTEARAVTASHFRTFIVFTFRLVGDIPNFKLHLVPPLGEPSLSHLDHLLERECPLGEVVAVTPHARVDGAIPEA